MKHSYIICDALFPNSKFILTLRNPEIWFESVCNFDAKHFYSINDISNYLKRMKKNNLNCMMATCMKM